MAFGGSSKFGHGYTWLQALQNAAFFTLKGCVESFSLIEIEFVMSSHAASHEPHALNSSTDR
jgi:hypothetical protein